MNRFLLIAATAVVVAGCVNDSPLFVVGMFPIDPKGTGACELTPGDVSQYAGSLDLSGAASYQLIASLKSELDANLDTKADNVTLITGKQRNTVILDQINFTYVATATATVPVFTLEPETLPITVPVAPGSTQNIRMNLLGPKAFEALNKAVVNPGDLANIRVKFEFTGQLNSGGKIKSTAITFPITVFRSGTTCPAGQFFCPTGACGNIGGQDGARLLCSGAMGCPTK